MNVVFERTPDKRIAETENRMDALRTQIRAKEADVARDLEVAAACDTEGWTSACKIFESEKIRLALLHVKTLDEHAQWQIRGQCLQMELLAGKAEEVEFRLAEGMRELEDLKDSLAEEGNKLLSLRSKK